MVALATSVHASPGVYALLLGSGISSGPCSLRSEMLPAPYRRPVPPPGTAAVYVFARSSEYGRSAPCGPGIGLKVGRVGPNNRQRFKYSMGKSRRITFKARCTGGCRGSLNTVRCHLLIHTRRLLS